MNKKIFVLMGPSGSGKSTLAQVFKTWNIPELISTTTRPIRLYDNEVDGINYHFVNFKQFSELDMVEWAKYDNNLYGLSRNEVESKLANHDYVFAVLNKDGVKRLLELYGEDVVKVIYVYCSLQTLYNRLAQRGDSLAKIEDRMRNIEKDGELDNIVMADYVIINDKGTLEENKDMLNYIIEVESK